MYDNLGAQPGVQPGVPRPPTMQQPNPFGNAFYGAGSGLIRGGLGAYGEKILGSSSEYVQSNVSIMQGWEWLLFVLIQAVAYSSYLAFKNCVDEYHPFEDQFFAHSDIMFLL